MSLQEAEARAGSFDALRPDLQADDGGPPRIMARAEGFYTSEGKPWKRAPADGRIPADWWAQLRSVDPAANRATFRRPGPAWTSTDPNDKVHGSTDDILAIVVELERAAVEARFPEATVSTAAPQHAGGKDAEPEPTASPSNREENEIAIEWAAQAWREASKKDDTLTKKDLFERLKASRHWATRWTFNRFVEKVWRPARERAGLDVLASAGRPKR